jgi:hypothetical protein
MKRIVAACDERNAREPNHGGAERDMVGGKGQVAQEVPGDEERNRLVEVAGHESEIAAHQLGEDGAFGPAARGVVCDFHAPVERTVRRANFIGSHLDRARLFLA